MLYKFTLQGPIFFPGFLAVEILDHDFLMVKNLVGGNSRILIF